MLRKFLIRPEIVQDSTIMKQTLTSQTFRIAYHMVHAKQFFQSLRVFIGKDEKIQVLEDLLLHLIAINKSSISQKRGNSPVTIIYSAYLSSARI